MDCPPFLISTIINQECSVPALVDSGCLSYGLIDSRFVRKHNFERVAISPRTMEAFDAPVSGVVREVAAVVLDVNGYKRKAFLYVVPRLAGQDVMLGLPWLRMNQVKFHATEGYLTVGDEQVVVRPVEKGERSLDCVPISANAFMMNLRQRQRGRRKVEVFAASMADIEKALRPRSITDPRTKLPKHFSEFLDVADRTEADKLPPLRGPGIDHHIELQEVDGKTPEVPWGPLYKMSREELLVLRKTLTEYLDKGFVRVSNSPAAAPVLFVKKPGGGLRFCVDYRGLNKITRKDRYPLPLIYETLRTIGQAKWFTKLDVVAAFHKIRIAKGQEWMTAFRTRYGLFEWMVTPFGLANAPSTFQRYINWALRDYLDEFCSAYVDDILIYTDGSLDKHRGHVRKVLRRLRDAGLQIDIDKCEFEVQATKYLGFIIEAGKGIRMDPAKVEAIVQWDAPTSVKGVQSFLGFANFYRTFIKGFSKLTAPLTALVRKDQTFQWTIDADKAFEKLKQMFVSAPLLVRFDHERETVVETDASGWCVGGILLQRDNDGFLRPCAFYSKRMLPAECNYPIYDKELLAIIRSLEAWDAELRSVKEFQIRCDHKNLEYFMTVRKLTERQMRWSLILSRYNFVISYLPGKENTQADALSRRDQDLPTNTTDERVQHRTALLIRPEIVRDVVVGTIVLSRAQGTCSYLPRFTGEIKAAPVVVNTMGELSAQWDQAKLKDASYDEMVKAVYTGERKFPATLGVKVSISECDIEDNQLLFRGRKWVPDSEPLRTRLIQETHDSVMAGHPGREATAAILSRQFFWPNMLRDVRRFVRNCDVCCRTKAWRERQQGFLKPLPVPDRIWREISMDFVTDLPPCDGRTNLLVITDRLSKGVILEPMAEITVEAVAKVFLYTFYRRHGIPVCIVSDRGTQFVSAMWTRICQLLGIVRRLSTAYHPQTDGSTEQKNQVVEAYIRAFVSYAQDDWTKLMPAAELALNNRDASSTGVSPFFLMHGYHVEPLVLPEEPQSVRSPQSPVQTADSIVRKLRSAVEWAQSAMAVSQQEQEEQANRLRTEGPRFKVGDKVWLSLRNIKTDRTNKKLDWKNAKYTVTDVIGSHSYRLDTPPGIHNVFHSELLRLAATDPLPSQTSDDAQPPAYVVDDQEEYDVEAILRTTKIRRGRGHQFKVLVKWKGYARPTWEPLSALSETAALASYEAIHGPICPPAISSASYGRGGG